jgi:hypothetical protein
MQRCLAALGVVLALVLAAGVGTARAGDPAQTLSQTQSATNSVDQNAQAGALSVNASPNVAALNWGSVNQSSGSHASATATNTSSSTQSIEQNQRSLQNDSAVRHHRHHVKHHRHHGTWGACSA